MAKRTVGSRTVGAKRPTPTITRAQLQEHRDMGRRVVERPDNIVLLDGFRKFKVVGEAKAEPMPADVGAMDEMGGPIEDEPMNGPVAPPRRAPNRTRQQDTNLFNIGEGSTQFDRPFDPEQR